MTTTAIGASAPAVFNFQSLDVRVFADDAGEPWFCASDVCAVLGYRNDSDAVAKHCRAPGVAKRDLSSGGQMREMTFINEGNLYRLIIKSRKPEAADFERQVMEEILPAIRKTGCYEGLQAHLAAPIPSFANRRWMIVVAPDGNETATPIETEAMVVKMDEIPCLIREPGFLVEGSLLTEILHACADRLASKLAGLLAQKYNPRD